MNFYIDIENASGTKYGSGPIISALEWEFTQRLDALGEFRFRMPASDPQAAIIQKKRTVKAYALIDGVWANVGDGIIDHIEYVPQADGTVLLDVSGNDLWRELTYRTVGTLSLDLYETHQSGVVAVAAFAPSGWEIAGDDSPTFDTSYGQFAGENVFGALLRLGNLARTHMYRPGSRFLYFTHIFTDSGIRAIRANGGDLASETCAIVDLSVTEETYDIITRIYPRGAGNGEAQLTTWAASTYSPPAGYVFSRANNYIENTAAIAEYGLIERWVDFRDIRPVSNTATDLSIAANVLAQAARYELSKRLGGNNSWYTLSVAGCSTLLKPTDTIRVVYHDELAGLAIDEQLNIVETIWRVDPSGVQTTRLMVTANDRRPESDGSAISDSLGEGHIYQLHPQLNANSYVLPFVKNVDTDESATLRFRLGNEVVQIQQVLFEFQLLPFESTIKSVSSAVATTASGGSSIVSASSGGSHGHTVTIAAHTHSVTVPAHNHSVTIAAHSHSVTIAAHSHTVTIAAHQHTVTIASHSHTVTIAGHSHTVTISAHDHGVPVYGMDVPSENPLARLVYCEADNDRFTAAFGSGVNENATTESGGSSEPTSNTTSQSTPTTTELAQSTPTSSQLAQSTPTSSELAQLLASSTTIASTQLTSSSTTDTVVSSASGGASAPSSVAAGDHTHTVTIAAHTHTVTPILTTVYGIFREEAANTYTLAQLEYQVNSEGWADLSTATEISAPWYQIDITDDVINADTLRQATDNNQIEIRAKAGAPAKTVTIEAQLSIRNTIQAIAYA